MSAWPRAPLNQAQVEAVGRIRRLHASGPIAQTSEEVSLREMLRTCGGYSASAGELASYRSGSVSMPTDQTRPLQTDTVLQGDALEAVSHPFEQMLLSEAELAAVLQETTLPGKHMDLVLDSCETLYAEFLVELFISQVVRFDLEARCDVGCFFLTKKAPGWLRLVIDARRANRLFRKPPWCPLGSVETLCKVRIPKSLTLFVSQEDIEDFFCR